MFVQKNLSYASDETMEEVTLSLHWRENMWELFPTLEFLDTRREKKIVKQSNEHERIWKASQGLDEEAA